MLKKKKKSSDKKVFLFISSKASKEPATQALNALSFGAFVVAGQPSEMSIKQEPQCCTHYPFMSSDN